jgi:hypothetical protein
MRAIKQNLKLNKEQFQRLKDYTKTANCLYNCAIYLCKQHYEATGKYIGYGQLDKQMQSNEHYRKLPSFNSQQLIRLVDKNYRNTELKRKSN